MGLIDELPQCYYCGYRTVVVEDGHPLCKTHAEQYGVEV